MNEEYGNWKEIIAMSVCVCVFMKIIQFGGSIKWTKRRCLRKDGWNKVGKPLWENPGKP